MTGNKQKINPANNYFVEQEFEGLYGPYRITLTDKVEIQRYRLSLLLCGISFTAGIIQWLLIGPSLVWLWLISLAIGIGLTLNWIHIYLRSLHQVLKAFWIIGCIGILILIVNNGAQNLVTNLSNNPRLIISIGPLFAALTGIGFKEFFCFRRPEAIGLTLLVPLSLLGYISELLSKGIAISMLSVSAFLLLILSLRKFGMDAASDVGDKSIFNYLDSQKTANAL